MWRIPLLAKRHVMNDLREKWVRKSQQEVCGLLYLLHLILMLFTTSREQRRRRQRNVKSIKSLNIASSATAACHPPTLSVTEAIWVSSPCRTKHLPLYFRILCFCRSTKCESNAGDYVWCTSCEWRNLFPCCAPRFATLIIEAFHHHWSTREFELQGANGWSTAIAMIGVIVSSPPDGHLHHGRS